jgi:hypothetical protein
MPSRGLQTKSRIHCKHKRIIEISLKLQTPKKIKKKKKTKQMWNERHGKHNWNKERFKVYLGCHLKEVAISPYPCSNILQIAWTKNKTDIENWMAA